ncbi:hypothetical protein B0H67DRAFT_77850 [Lasiosphaeris hirsuta]|uniref:Uncharacterized protein n=1 Tax=Lasiosphaeris hirsuta TaxID=260670 RepID=A0AA40EBR2_9PEZI|nr:hypothetical protein B0H67DRAFT_77850 [Lasiosphaeris hirsuta]
MHAIVRTAYSWSANGEILALFGPSHGPGMGKMLHGISDKAGWDKSIRRSLWEIHGWHTQYGHQSRTGRGQGRQACITSYLAHTIAKCAAGTPPRRRLIRTLSEISDRPISTACPSKYGRHPWMCTVYIYTYTSYICSRVHDSTQSLSCTALPAAVLLSFSPSPGGPLARWVFRSHRALFQRRARPRSVASPLFSPPGPK